jgi:hypothetical protein
MKTRIAIAVLDGFLAITALAGATIVLPTLPTGMLAGSVFPDFLVPGLALGVLVAGSALVAAAAVLLRPKLGAAVAMISTLMIVVFEVVEIATIGYHWLQVAYIVLGLVIGGLGFRLWIAAGGYSPSPGDLGHHHSASQG